MVKTKPALPTREADRMKQASGLAKRLANERIYDGMPEKDKKRLFEIVAVLSDKLGAIGIEIEGKGDEIFDIYCGLQKTEAWIEEISGFFMRSDAMIAELKENRFVSESHARRKTLEKAELRVNDMRRNGFDSVKAGLVIDDLARLSAEADRVGRFGNAKKA